MEGGGIRRRRRWKNLKQKFGFNGMGCCGSSWGFGVHTQMSVREEEEEEEEEEELETMAMGNENPTVVRHLSTEEECLGQNQISSTTGMMNLATALAAERQFRASEGSSNGTSIPLKISLMRMLEEGDREEEEEEGNGVVVQLLSCCVCMERRKGAAFIPCGHTFCRVCSRELWLNRGSCPLCNRSILDILDIF